MRIITVFLLLFGSNAFAQLIATPEQMSSGFTSTVTPIGIATSHQFDQPVVVATINYTPVPPQPPVAPPTIPLGALLSAFQSPNRAQPPNLSDIGTEAGYMNSAYCPDGRCGQNIRNKGIDGAGIYNGANQAQVAPNACMQKIVESGRIEADCWQHKGLGCATPPSPQAKYDLGTFKGSCARSVASALTRAGINNGSAMGDAKDMGPALIKLGFQDEHATYPTPELAPIGSILIYGPARPGASCTGLGSEYGHAEIKDANERYLSDGIAYESMSKNKGSDCRPLIGVYTPKSVKNCG